MKKKKVKMPTKREREQMFVDHNVPQLAEAILRTRIAHRKLEAALAEVWVLADLLSPLAKKAGPK